MRLSSSLKVLALAAALATPATSALAWGASGHRVVGVVAASSLPSDVPAFLRTPTAIAAIGEYAREPDRWKGSGKIHDTDRDSAHFLDIDDQGRMYGGPMFTVATLPPTRADYETALRAVGQDAWKAGYLPYAIIDGYQQLVKDFTYWRILTAVVKIEKDATKLAYYKADLKRREELLLRDLGVWAHYVGDASQPLHLSVHYNGWGDYPNPNGYTNSRQIHSQFEGPLAKAVGDQASIQALVPAYQACDCSIETRVVGYLSETWKQTEPLYQLEKAGALVATDPRGKAFVQTRIAAGATALRDLVVDAWSASAKGTIGYRPEISVADVESGKADPWLDLYGKD
ncbi:MULTISPECIES: S1/P1 Nuclease [unclassified Caulobacter]|uniref:S1/P1 Nuclease n=1 Tax=unclassified Caulobacter TaxID=2648921 RepID=UPI00078483DE|nr:MULTISPECIES: S1/P1 Nuclease [unclassified Caulobacter]AZS20650.1 S1/P1 Nuclease [Caulobacter sp. FWC26]